MNWTLKNGSKNAVEKFLSGEFRQIMAEGIEKFAPLLGIVQDLISFDGENLGPDAHGPQDNYAEYPEGYFHEGPSYRYRMNVGFYENGKFVSMNPPEYTLTVTGLGEQRSLPARFLRERKIKNVHPIS